MQEGIWSETSKDFFESPPHQVLCLKKFSMQQINARISEISQREDFKGLQIKTRNS